MLRFNSIVLASVFLLICPAFAAEPLQPDPRNRPADNSVSPGGRRATADETQPGGGRERMRKKDVQAEQSDNGRKFLTAAELEDLFPDTEITHVNPNNSSSRVRMFFHADGQLSGAAVTKKTSPITGKWSVTPRGTLCFSSEQQGQQCFYLERHGKDELVRYNLAQKPMPGINWTIAKSGPRAHLVPQ